MAEASHAVVVVESCCNHFERIDSLYWSDAEAQYRADDLNKKFEAEDTGSWALVAAVRDGS